MVRHGVDPVVRTATSPQFKFEESDRQHKKFGSYAVADLTITRDLTDPLKFSLHFP